MSDLSRVEQRAFNGGMNTFSSDDTLAENEVNTLTNMKINPVQNAIEQVGGTKYTISPTTQDDMNVVINSIFRFNLSTGVNHSLAHYTITAPASQNQIFVFDGTTSKGDLDFSPAITSPITDYAVFQNNIYMVNGVDQKVFSWDGDTGAMAGLVPASTPITFKPSLIEMYQGRAYYAGDSDDPSTMIASKPAKPDTFDSPFVEPLFVINESDGDKITSLKVLGSNLIVFKQNSFYIVEGSLPFRITQHPSVNVGALDDNTVQKTQLGLVFLAKTGVYLYNGRSLTLLSRNITNDLRSAVLGAAGSFSSAYHNNIYYLFHKPLASNIIQDGFSFDLNEVEAGGQEIPATKLKGWNISHSIVQNQALDNNDWYAIQDGTSNILQVNARGQKTFYIDASTANPISPDILSRWFTFGDRSVDKQLYVLYFFSHEALQDLTGEVEYERDGENFTHTFTLTSTGVSLWDKAKWDVDKWDAGTGVFRYKVVLPQGIFCNRARVRLFSTLGTTFLNLDGMRIHFRPLRELN
jgi:hypothetical protein